jgi:integrase
MWKYYRNAGRLAGLNIFESQDQRNISNVWTHLLRKSCAKRMEDLGAKESLIARKLRHSSGSVTQRYTKVDINALLDWEEKHFTTLQVLGSVSQ